LQEEYFPQNNVIPNHKNHTILKPDCGSADIKKIADDAMRYQFAAICIPPYYIKDAARLLAHSPVKVATVIGFPMGYSTIPAKVEEIKRAINDGVDELDVVVNIAAVKNQDWNYIRNDIESTTRMGQLRSKVVKIIFETSLLTDEEIIKLCGVCNDVEVDYAKTSTGYQGGATVHAVELMRTHLDKKIKIKASGGIRTYEDAQKMVAVGANRLGCSSSIAILKGQPIG